MTDYKNLKLIATSSPHIRAAENTRSIMLDVIIGLLPALVFSAVWFGIRALALVVVSVVGCVFWEWLYRKIMKQPQSVGDLSAVVTGILLAFVCPVTTEYWAILLGDFCAIVVVKQLYGGIGKNFVNPALVGRAILLASFSGMMTTWVAPGVKAGLFGGLTGSPNVDAVTAATPMALLHGATAESFAELTATYTIRDMFQGTIGGSLGEVSALLLIAGGVYLMFRKVITWHIPVAFIGTVAVLTFIFPRAGASGMDWMLYNLFGGGLMLGAFFMATDYATSPVTHKGQLIFGIGCGLFTVFIRYFGSYNEGVCYSILIMNLFVALIDRYVKPRRFGVVKSQKKEAAAK